MMDFICKKCGEDIYWRKNGDLIEINKKKYCKNCFKSVLNNLNPDSTKIFIFGGIGWSGMVLAKNKEEAWEELEEDRKSWFIDKVLEIDKVKIPSLIFKHFF